MKRPPLFDILTVACMGGVIVAIGLCVGLYR